MIWGFGVTIMVLALIGWSVAGYFYYRSKEAAPGFYSGLANGEMPLLTEAPPKAKRMVVATLAPAAPERRDLHGEAALELMKKLWQAELETVLPDRPDLIVLPEACDRFPSMSAEERLQWYEFRGDRMLDFFGNVARDNHCYLAYSAARKLADGTYRNSTQLIDRQGRVVGIYNKNYPVPSETDDWKILCGRDSPVFETDFGRVGFAICFDLNFHELLERYAVLRPDLIVFSSMYHGGLMQNYWAYHCRSYLVAAVGCGCESTVVNPVGMVVSHTTNYQHNQTALINLDYELIHLAEVEKLQALKKKYGRGVTITDPGNLGVVLVTSELPDISAHRMIEEFKIERWDEYYARTVKHRNTPGKMEP